MSSFNWVPIVCATLIGLFVGVALMLVLAPAPAPVRLDLGTVPSATVQEDDPGWDCRTMGNRVCG